MCLGGSRAGVVHPVGGGRNGSAVVELTVKEFTNSSPAREQGCHSAFFKFQCFA